MTISNFATGVGASLPRLEDDRFLEGNGRFVGDIRMANMLDVAFLRSPVAHADITQIRKPQGAEHQVFTADDLTRVKGIRADSGLPGFRSSIQPVLAHDRIRHVNEPIAACVAATRAQAEDIAELIGLEYQTLPAVHDMLHARDADAPLLHPDWQENVFLESSFESGFEAAQGAPVKFRQQFRTARQCMSPIEGRGVVAWFDEQVDQLVIYSSTQMPHIIRNGLAECLGMDQGRIRVIAPDVGGGFGYKGILLAEEICLGWLAMHLRRPVRWIEDRREQLAGNANCREHWYDVTGYASADGRLLAVDCEAIVDSGAYSAYPFSACLESAQVGSILPGPYKMDGYRCKTWSVATNKPAILPYRGVARTGVCFAMEQVMDGLARKLGIEPAEFRRRNLVTAPEMPFTNITNKIFDSGDYVECLDRAVTALDLPALRARQARGEMDGRKLGVGLSIFCEQGAHGTSVYSGWGIPMVPGFEQATARMTPDGGLELRVGVHSHGQSLETTLAQIANEVLGVQPKKVKLIHGDTAMTPYSTGTWGSRCIVMAGGAVATACEDLSLRIKVIAAKLLQADPQDIILGGDEARCSAGSVPLSEIAKIWYHRPQDLPDGVDPGGLEVTKGYKTVRDTGTFSYACHAVIVAVDTGTGEVEILDYRIVEDGGVLVNPMVVDGQVWGGAVQGIGTALYEEMPYDSDGQPLSTTLADYLLPGAAESPSIAIDHMETPSPISRFGQKGIGESGAIGPPAAIASAVNDALQDFGAEVADLPITPERVMAALAIARGDAS